MATKYKFGLVNGSRDRINLPVTVWDDAFGTLDRDAALAVVEANAPATLLGCEITDDISVTERSKSAIAFSVSYARPAKNQILRRATMATRSKKIHHFIAAVGVFDSTGEVTSTNRELKWKLDRQGRGEEFNSGKPLAIDPLNETRAIDFDVTADLVTDAYLDAVEDLVSRGCFNSARTYDKPANTLQLVRFTATERDDNNWELSYGFGYQPVQTNISVDSDIVIPTLRGIDYYWLVEKEVYDDGDIQPKVTKAVVGQVWPTGDMHICPQAGTLTTRTSDSAGVITIGYEHAIPNSTNIKVFWDGGSRAGTISGTTTYTLTFSGGSGDNLPLVNEPVIVLKAV